MVLVSKSTWNKRNICW